MHCEVGQFFRLVRELEDEVTRLRKECDCKVEDVNFERDGIQVRLHSMVSQLSRARSLTAVREHLEHHCGRSAASHFQLEWLLAIPISGSADKVAPLIIH